METWLVSSVAEGFKSMTKVINLYATTITLATSTTSTHCSKPSRVLRVTHFSQRRQIWNNIWLLVFIVLNMFTDKRFTNWEKRFLKSCMQSTSHIEVSKNCSRTWQYWVWIHLCQGSKLIQANWNYNVDREACAYISFHLVKLDTGTHFLCNANPHHVILSLSPLSRD